MKAHHFAARGRRLHLLTEQLSRGVEASILSPLAVLAAATSFSPATG